jgi:hypothetical protein
MRIVLKGAAFFSSQTFRRHNSDKGYTAMAGILLIVVDDYS